MIHPKASYSHIRRYQFPDISPDLPACFVGPKQPDNHNHFDDPAKRLPCGSQWCLLLRAARAGRGRGYQVGHQKGWNDGYAVGIEEGRKAGFDEFRTEISKEEERMKCRADALWSELSNLRAQTMEHLGEALAQLVFSAVQKILEHELTTSKASLQQIIEESLQLLPQLNGLVIKCHPEDRPFIEQMADQYPEQWSIEEDSSIMPGGFKLQACGGMVDASVSRRVELCMAPVVESLG